MNNPNHHLFMLQRRLDFLQTKEPQSWTLAEVGALTWALENLRPIVEREDTILREQRA